jgi:patatin-like phospholipase/acyl hydrolase
VSKKFKILSLDGGGVRGILPLTILMELEKRTGKSIWTMFDFIVGTSTGALIALALTVPKNKGTSVKSAEEIRKIYLNECPLIFNRSTAHYLKTGGGLWGPKYDGEHLVSVASELFGESSMYNALTGVCIPAYSLYDGCPMNFFNHTGVLACDAAVSASSAPTYFPAREFYATHRVNTPNSDIAAIYRPDGPYRCIDGAIYANNPEAIAAKHVFDIRPEATREDLFILSLGTGVSRPDPETILNQNFGASGWVLKANLIDIMINADSDWYTQETKTMVPNTIRMQTEIPHKNYVMDDASEQNLAGLLDLAEKFKDERSEQIDVVIKTLLD